MVLTQRGATQAAVQAGSPPRTVEAHELEEVRRLVGARRHAWARKDTLTGEPFGR